MVIAVEAIHSETDCSMAKRKMCLFKGKWLDFEFASLTPKRFPQNGCTCLSFSAFRNLLIVVGRCFVSKRVLILAGLVAILFNPQLRQRSSGYTLHRGLMEALWPFSNQTTQNRPKLEGQNRGKGSRRDRKKGGNIREGQG